MQKLITAIKKNWSYASVAYIDKEIKYLKKQQYKSVLLVLSYPNFTIKWHEILEENIFLSSVLVKRPILYTKPYKCYLSSKWDINKRLKVILDSYKFIKSKSILIESLDSKVVLLPFELRDNSFANLVLSYHDKFRNEGEMVLSIDVPDKEGIFYSLAFSFEELKKDYWIIRIGCIQASNGIIDNDKIKKLHKNLHGMRPKVFLLFALQQIAIKLNIKEIYSVSNSIQAHKRKHLIHLPWRHKINSDYDALFKEFNGVLGNDGWFKLPNNYQKKDISKIPSHKRAYYIKRYKLMDEIAILISNINFN